MPVGPHGLAVPPSRRRTAACTAPSTILATNPTAIRPMIIWIVVTIRATSLTGTMSPNPTVAKTVTVK